MSHNTSENIKLLDVVKSLFSREGNVTGTNINKYMAAAKEVYTELNLYTIRKTKRMFVKVDKQTNTIRMPDDFVMLSSLSVIDPYCGEIIPLVINTTILKDVVDSGVNRSCECECGCDSKLCGNIFKYESIQRQVTAPLPGGGGETMDYTETTRKRIDEHGNVMQEICGPVLKYDSETGVHTATVVECQEYQICQLEIKECGCVVESPENIEKFSSVCCGGNYETECGTICCPEDNPYGYNFVDGSSKIAFASNFKFGEVLVRYYADVPTKELEIPRVAKQAIIAGIKAYLIPHDRKEPLWRAQYWKNEFEVEKTKLTNILNRYSLKEFYSTLFNPNRK